MLARQYGAAAGLGGGQLGAAAGGTSPGALVSGSPAGANPPADVGAVDPGDRGVIKVSPPFSSVRALAVACAGA